MKISNLKLRDTDKTASCLVDVDIKFWVEKDIILKRSVQNISMNFTTLVDLDNILRFHVTNVSLDPAKYPDGNLLNYGIGAGLADFDNWVFNNHNVTLPLNLISMFTLKDLKIINHQDYIEVGLTPQFNPAFEYKKFLPQTLPHMATKWSYLREHIDKRGNYSWSYEKPLTHIVYYYATEYEPTGIVKMMMDQFLNMKDQVN